MGSRIRHTYLRALITLAGLAIFTLVITLAAWGLFITGLAEITFMLIGSIFFAFFSLILLIVWILGLFQKRRTADFLASDRPLIRWTYSPEEWRQIKETAWQEESADWKVQLGCLASLLALVGLLTGIMVGWEQGLGQAILTGLGGLATGGLAGASLGAVVAGGNYLGARLAYRRSQPGQVALGPDEVFASDNYFRGNGKTRYILSAVIQRGHKISLELQIKFPLRPRMPAEERWSIPVPHACIDRIVEILPQLAPYRDDGNTAHHR